MIVLDTNVVSELVRAAPDPRVLAWVASVPRADCAIAVVTEGELMAGVAMMPSGQRRDAVQAAISAIVADALSGQVLPLDRLAVPHFAAFHAARRASGRPASMADALIGAIARAHGASLLATRNLADFEGCGVKLVDPWGA